ncbi:hypothetical protein NP493_438g00009 [Ridgeia piscesae]|uniref:BZIP domain-containing protein n=1 Tax=Ridgeia piscesae TaxID=27915 RepID=A0AAD9NV25_RIDPI|nr:hypothetical protein NP493_438g00009 [Ridgeia piscesae]
MTPLSEATQHLRDASRPCQMQAVPTLELLSMDELNSLDMDEDFADLNLDMYLNQPETSGSSSSDGASCCAVRQNLKTHIQRKRRERGELKELTALTNCDQDEAAGAESTAGESVAPRCPYFEFHNHLTCVDDTTRVAPVWATIRLTSCLHRDTQYLSTPASSYGNQTAVLMSPDEYEKRLRRRQQNRRAARKFREKKKMHAQGIIQDYRRLQIDNGRLQRYVTELQRQKAELEEIVMQHSATCQLVCPPTSLPAASDFSNIDLSNMDGSYLQELQFC